MNDWYLSTFGALLRPHEVDGVPAALYFLMGTNFVITFCEVWIALLAVIYVSFGDPSASLAGQLFHKHNYPLGNGKSLIGLLTNICVCMVLTVVFLHYFEGWHLDVDIVMYAIVGAFSAGMSAQK